MKTAVCIEVTKSCAAVSISSLGFNEIFKLVLFSKWDANLLQFTGPFDNEGCGGLRVGWLFLSRITGLWSEEMSFELYMLNFIWLGIDERKKSKMSGYRF